MICIPTSAELEACFASKFDTIIVWESHMNIHSVSILIPNEFLALVPFRSCHLVCCLLDYNFHRIVRLTACNFFTTWLILLSKFVGSISCLLFNFLHSACGQFRLIVTIF
jgi:hypothetical protein